MNLRLKARIIETVYEYCLEHDYSTHLVVITGGNSVIPKINDEATITLNLTNNAIRDFSINEHNLTFKTRFSGVIHNLSIDIEEIVWIGAPGTDTGLAFSHPISNGSTKKSKGKKKLSSTQVQHKISNSKLRLL